MKKMFLCLVLDRCSNKELAEYTVEATSNFFARHIGANLFEKSQKYQPNLRKHTNWYVDSCSK